MFIIYYFGDSIFVSTIFILIKTIFCFYQEFKNLRIGLRPRGSPVG